MIQSTVSATVRTAPASTPMVLRQPGDLASLRLIRSTVPTEACIHLRMELDTEWDCQLVGLLVPIVR